MKLARVAVAFLVLTTFGAAAQDRPGRTREQVLRELAEARRMGDIIISGCGGGTLREAFPNRYPSRDAVAAKRWETEVQRSEDIPARVTGTAEASR